jgi:hypothetical protein
MMEYTLVFRRRVTTAATSRTTARPWVAVRPAPAVTRGPRTTKARPGDGAQLAQVFIVPICSALGMDSSTYDRFLTESGAIAAALRVLTAMSVDQPADAEDARKEIQALVMAAEVQHIVNQLSA